MLVAAIAHALLAHGDMAVALIAAGTLPVMYRSDRRRARAGRGRLFAHCLDLFQTYRVTQDGLGYPVLTGRYRGFNVKLEPVVDHIAWRKIPSLWLKVTVLQPNPCGTLDFLMRPQGVEFYSPSGGLSHHLKLPEGWPKDALLCTDDAANLPDLARLTPFMVLFDDPRMKELVVTPRGTRLVRQIWQAERAHYLVLRQVKFSEEALDPEILRALIDQAISIGLALSAPAKAAPQMRELLTA